MKVTVAIAENISYRMTEKRRRKADEMTKIIKETVERLYIDKMDKDVVSFWQNHPNYTSTKSHVTLHGDGFNSDHVNTCDLPSNKSIYGNSLSLSTVDANKLFKVIAKRDQLKKEAEQLKQNIKVALISLKTYKNVEIEFPEAFKLLPKRAVSQALTINIVDIRAAL